MSSFFSENHIRQILQSVSIVDVVGSYISLKPKGKEQVGLCPFHDDKKPSLSVSASKQIFKCFACGAGGDAIKFLMLREQLSFPEAVRLLAERAGVKLPQQQVSQGEGADRGELAAENLWAARFFRNQFEHQDIGARARAYVAERGITETTAKRFGLGWAPDTWDRLVNQAEQDQRKIASLLALGLASEREQGGYYDRFRERLIFPVIDALGRVVGFGGRTLGDDPAKYLNSPDSALFEKGRTLYGLHLAKDAIVKNRRAIVVEGYTDCIMAHQFGLDNVVATLGTALTTQHARALSRYADRIVLVFDPDQAGQKAADRAIEIFFGLGIEVSVATLPAGADPCQFLIEQGPEHFSELINNAAGALDYAWQMTLAKLDQAQSVQGQKTATDQFMLLVARACQQGTLDRMAEGFLLNHVAKLTGQPAHRVHQRIEQLQRSLRTNRTQDSPAQQQRTLQVPTDSYASTQREILEVLLNRPELFELVQQELPDANEFTDDILRVVAQRIWKYCQAGHSGTLGEMLATCPSTELCGIMTEMAQRGSERGNYEMTLAGALRNVRQIRAEHAHGKLSAMLATAAQDYSPEAETAMLAEIQAKWQPNVRRAGAR